MPGKDIPRRPPQLRLTDDTHTTMKAYSTEADIHNIQSTTIVSEAEQWHIF